MDCHWRVKGPEAAAEPSVPTELPDPRQLLGQPAGHGIASGTARVIGDNSELFDFKKGEILVFPGTKPAWKPVLGLVNGVVCDRGRKLRYTANVVR